MGYVQSYEDEDLTDFFIGMLGTVDEEGSMVFRTTQRFAVDNGKSLQFNSEPNNPFDVGLSDEKTVIGEEKQNEYLKNLPVDLSEYLIVYQEHTGDVPCDVQ